MSTPVTLPTWAVYLTALGSPASVFAGTLIGHTITRRGASELERRSRREETMRNLRWAAELAVSTDERTAQLGIAQLNALADSDLLDERQQLFVDAALESVLEDAIDEIERAGEAAQVIRIVDGDYEEAAETVPLDVSSDHQLTRDGAVSDG